jgi:hypothetical protein
MNIMLIYLQFYFYENITYSITNYITYDHTLKHYYSTKFLYFAIDKFLTNLFVLSIYYIIPYILLTIYQFFLIAKDSVLWILPRLRPGPTKLRFGNAESLHTTPLPDTPPEPQHNQRI